MIFDDILINKLTIIAHTLEYYFDIHAYSFRIACFHFEKIVVQKNFYNTAIVSASKLVNDRLEILKDFL